MVRCVPPFRAFGAMPGSVEPNPRHRSHTGDEGGSLVTAIRRRLLASCAFLIFLPALLLAAGVPSVDASIVPNGVPTVDSPIVPKVGAVEVTGYGRVALIGSSQPVTIKANAHQAAAIRRALRTLVAVGPTVCFASGNAFTITFLVRKGSQTTPLLAAEDDCPTPGVVTISEHGEVIQTLRESCSMRAAVLTVLPHGQAKGTRQDRRSCSS